MYKVVHHSPKIVETGKMQMEILNWHAWKEHSQDEYY